MLGLHVESPSIGSGLHACKALHLSTSSINFIDWHGDCTCTVLCCAKEAVEELVAFKLSSTDDTNLFYMSVVCVFILAVQRVPRLHLIWIQLLFIERHRLFYISCIINFGLGHFKAGALFFS